MKPYVVTYDLHRPGQQYQTLIQQLESFNTRWRVQQSVWIVATSLAAAAVRDKLTPHLDSNDKLIVAGLDGEAAWRGYGEDVTKWLKSILEKPARTS